MPTSTSSPGSDASHPVRGFGLPRRARLTHVREFRRVYSRGARASGHLIVVVAARRREPGHRLGVAVSKENGSSVRRNKLKRILREAFRLERPDLPGQFDIVLIPKPSGARLELTAVRRELVELIAALAEREDTPRTQRRRRRRRWVPADGAGAALSVAALTAEAADLPVPSDVLRLRARSAPRTRGVPRELARHPAHPALSSVHRAW